MVPAKTLEDVIRMVNEQQKVVKKQQKEIQVLKDVHEIQNLMGRYVYLHEVCRDPEFPDTMYAQKTPGISSEVARMGVFVDKGLRKLYKKPEPGSPLSDMRGMLFTHPLATPVIEVAGDGKTAKGLWMSPGYETSQDPATKKLVGCLCYTKYGCDFVKEAGKWKMWHYHVYRIFLTPMNTPFTEEWEANVRDKAMGAMGAGGPSPFGKADKPTTYDHPYSKTTERELVPAPPEPYETFSDTFSYGA